MKHLRDQNLQYLIVLNLLKSLQSPAQKHKDTHLLILFKEDYFAKKKKRREQNKV